MSIIIDNFRKKFDVVTSELVRLEKLEDTVGLTREERKEFLNLLTFRMKLCRII